MPQITAPATEQVVTTAQALLGAGHGDKGPLVDSLGAAIGRSRATVYRRLSTLTTVPGPRKRRLDADSTSLPRHEAELISAVLMESLRKNGKRLMTIGRALQVLRYQGLVRAERVDPATGEATPLSVSAVARGLRLHALHPDQLLQPRPATELRSLHPNHVWQIDASLCVLYYLSQGATRSGGLQALPAERFYKNKPAALERVAAERVWRYAVTDHFSGSLFVHYVLGAESGLNLAEAFIEAIGRRDDDPFHGVPLILMMDKGSANTSGLFKNLARRLQVELIAHAPGNARVTGQVENAHDLIECDLEAALSFQEVHSLEELNEWARVWARDFNATAEHSRHGRTRTDVWLRIMPEQLRIAPPADVCRELLTHEPEERKVSPMLTVQFKAREFDVRGVPGVVVGAKLPVTLAPYQPDAACIVLFDAEGKELLHSVPLVARNDAGFREDAPVIGESYARHADTPADTNRKALERLAMGAATDEEAARRRKAKAIPFGGSIDPLREAREADLPTAIAKRGEALAVGVRTTALEPQLLDSVGAMLRIVGAIGRHLTPAEHAFMSQRYAAGVPEDQLDALIAQFNAGQADGEPQRAAGGLRAV